MSSAGGPGSGRLRAGLVGLGAMGRNHARVLAGLDGVELVAAVDPAVEADDDPSGSDGTGPDGAAPDGTGVDGVTSEDVAGLGVPVLRDISELLALGIDYAVVACPTALHEEIGLELAACGVCALIEKPLAHSVLAARRLVDAFESAGLVAGVGHIERFNPAVQQLRERLANAELGEVYQVVTRRQGPFPNRLTDIGVVKDLATHDIDLTGWITGQDYTSVAARAVSKSGRPHEDLVTVIAELSGGTVSNHLVNWLSPLKERFVSVTGAHGCYVADTLTADLTFYANGAATTEWEALRAFRGVAEGDMVRYAVPKREPLLIEHQRFRDAVDGKPSDIVTLRQGLRTVEVSAAVLESARQGTTLRAEPVPDG